MGDRWFGSQLLFYLFIVYLLVRLFFSSVASDFSMLLLLIPNVGITLLNVGGTTIPLLNLLICLALLKLVLLFGHVPLTKSYLFLVGAVVAYEWGHVVYYDIKSIFLLFSWSGAVVYVSLFLYYSQETYNHRLAVTYFIAGVLISALFGIMDFVDRYGSLLNHNATIRFFGGAGDANYFSMYSMMAMFCLLYIISRQTKKALKIVYPLLFLFFMAFGVLSLSRMFMMVVSLLCLMLLVNVIFSRKRNKRLIHFLLLVSLFLSIFVFHFREEVGSLVGLLFSRFTDFMDDPAGLTSNRNILAEQYLEMLKVNYEQLLFGIGIQEYHIRSGILLEAHNFLLELLVVWGIVGFLAFGGYLLSLFKLAGSSSSLNGTSMIGWLPLLCIGVSFMSINAVSNESFFLLLLFAIKHLYEYALILDSPSMRLK
ncbi:hypothetical protein HNO89_002127 [Sporosarcina luteola]|nr:hypothetical protein [Sporosarcina luteola]